MKSYEGCYERKDFTLSPLGYFRDPIYGWNRLCLLDRFCEEQRDCQRWAANPNCRGRKNSVTKKFAYWLSHGLDRNAAYAMAEINLNKPPHLKIARK